jgi:CO/xanthine dehydrogenase FAD-binding subunit
MSLHPQFARPRKIDQAVSLLENLGAGTLLIAGGQELMPHVNYGRLMPTVIVDIGGLPELRGIRDDGGLVSIGALTVHRQLQRDPLVAGSLPLLAYAAAQVGGGWQVHNRGTIGGNIVSMHPLYDIVPPLIALGAEVEIVGAGGVRRMALAALVRDTSHGLGTSTVLTRVLVKPQAEGAGWSYQKLKITEGSYGSANAAAVVSLDGSGHIDDLGVIIGAVSERPIDASGPLRRLLAGRSLDARTTLQVERDCASLATQPLADQQGGAEYRAAMAGVVARRAIEAACRMAARAA